MLREIKRKIINWLLRDIEIDYLRVRNIKVGDNTVVIKGDRIVFPQLTADPSTLEAGMLFYRGDIDKWRYSPDGASIKDVGLGPDGVKICTDASGNLTICAGGISTGDIADESVTQAKIAKILPTTYSQWSLSAQSGVVPARGIYIVASDHAIVYLRLWDNLNNAWIGYPGADGVIISDGVRVNIFNGSSTSSTNVIYMAYG